jgi:hypothetical protein
MPTTIRAGRLTLCADALREDPPLDGDRLRDVGDGFFAPVRLAATRTFPVPS